MVAYVVRMLYSHVQPMIAQGQESLMEYGSIEREIHVEAAPEIVFEVISSPAHIREWWGADSDFVPVEGATGELAWPAMDHVVSFTVVEAEPPRRFSFRWVHPGDELATAANSLLVTFDLVPSGEGTVVRFSESGFREIGWEAAVLEEQYNDHVKGWDRFIPQLGDYITRLVSSS
jgi:uncharacterized protein YndB with AHSA1/START domain